MLANDSKPGHHSNFNLSTAAAKNRDAKDPEKATVEAMKIQI